MKIGLSENLAVALPASRLFLGLYLLTLLCLCGQSPALGIQAPGMQEEVSDAQRTMMLRAMAEGVKNAGVAYQAGKFDESAAALIGAMQSASQGLQGASPDLHEKAQAYLDRIERAHALLQLEGMVLPPFDRPRVGENWQDYAANGKATRLQSERVVLGGSNRPRPLRGGPMKSTDSPGLPTSSGVSFVKDVAPILVQHCGGCHIRERRGQLTLESYAAIMSGPAAGVIVFAGDPVGSRLIETIETGDMPRGGGRVPADQLQVLKDWVTQGAKFDGPNPAAPLAGLVRARSTNNRNDNAASRPEPQQPVGNADAMERVSFAKQVAPLLVANCTGCHVEAMQARGGLNMNSLAQLLQGGDSGEVVTANDGDGSLLVRKLRGEEGARMPAGGRPPLADSDIELISRWISQGAELDDGSPEQRLTVLASQAWAKGASPEELSARRKEMAQRNWLLGVAAEARQGTLELEDDAVLAIGTASEKQTRLVMETAAATLTKLGPLLPSVGSGELRGRITLFLFPRRYDYVEFAKMVETREIPQAWESHWRFDGVDAYVALVVGPQDTAKTLHAKLASPLASITVAARGDSPRWFREGMGRAMAVRIAGREDDRGRVWDGALPEAIMSLKEPKDLTESRLPPEQADLIGYGMAKSMLDRSGRKPLEGLFKALSQGEEFGAAFTNAFGGSPEEFLASWLVSASRTR